MSIFNKLADMNDEPQFKEVGEGEFSAIIDDVEIKEDIFQTEIRVRYQVAEGEFAGGKITQWLKMKDEDAQNDKKMKFYQWQFKAISGAESLKGLDPLELVAGSRGNTVIIEVKNNEYNGKIYKNVTCKTFVSKF